MLLVTVTTSVQLPPAGSVAPVRLTLPVVDVRLPPQPFAAAGDCSTVRLLGSESVRDAAVSAVPFELPNVMVSCDESPVEMLAGENVAATVAGVGAVTVKAALTVAALPPAGPVLSAPAARVFVKLPAVALETVTVTVQLALGGMSPPASVSVFDANVRL
jgi:hypothetical protein